MEHGEQELAGLGRLYHKYEAVGTSESPADLESPLLETVEWAAIGNLDVFFARVYR